jgi:hypothetical protein
MGDGKKMILKTTYLHIMGGSFRSPDKNTWNSKVKCLVPARKCGKELIQNELSVQKRNL